VTIMITSIVIVYAWMVTGSNTYPLEFLPIIILAIFMYGAEDRKKNNITVKQLETDEKDRIYNQLLQEHKRQESLRDAYYKKAKRFSRLSQIAKELGFLLTLEDINRNIISNLIKTIEMGDAYMLCGVGEDLQNLVLQVLESPSGIMPGDIQPADEFNMWVMRHRQPLIITDIAKDYRFNTTEILSKTRTRSLIIAPLITGNRMLGLIRIDSCKQDALTIDDLRLLTIISNIGALTIYNAQLYRQTEYLAIRDDLTGLFVKRYFQEKIETILTESQIQNERFSLLFLDLDRFKDLNDHFGHSVGDKVLQAVSQLIQDASPISAIVSRYGGEEFAIILPHTHLDEARETANKIRSTVEDQMLSIRREGIHTTISIGLAEFPKDGNSPEALIARADENLYEAKRAGRNRVVG